MPRPACSQGGGNALGNNQQTGKNRRQKIAARGSCGHGDAGFLAQHSMALPVFSCNRLINTQKNRFLHVLQMAQPLLCLG